MVLGVPKKMVVRLGWVALTFGAVQFLRMLNNIILTRILDPSVFGLMAVVVAVRVGLELISDLGVTQNIVSNPEGDQPDFYDTAWTLQVARNFLLAFLCVVLARPTAAFFGHPEIASLLPFAGIFLIFSGLESTSRGLIHKQMKVARFGIFEVALAFVTLVVHVTAALIMPNVWSVIIGMTMTSAALMIATYLFIPGLRHRFVVKPERARELFHFGKWVFFSSLVGFAAMNFDRLYFAKQITLAELGVYGIARNLAEIFSQIVSRAGGYVLYPTVAAAAGLEPAELRRKLLRGRRVMLLATALVLASFLACSNIVVSLLYDPRYSAAGVVLPVLCIGVWFGILAQCNDSILMGLSRPAYPAVSNAAKLLTYIVGVPIAFMYSGFMAAVCVIAAGEFSKYVTLWALTHKEHFHFGRDDLLLTAAFSGTALGVHQLLSSTGVGAHVHAIHFSELLRGFSS